MTKCEISNPEDDQELLIKYSVLYSKNPETYAQAFKSYGLTHIKKIYHAIDSIPEKDLDTKRKKFAVNRAKSDLEKMIQDRENQ